jgi:hypothetical protein
MCCTANEGPVRIQYKCLVPIYVFPGMKLLFSNRIIIFCLPVPTLIYLWEIYIFPDRSANSTAGKYVDRSWEYLNRSQTHECGIRTEAGQFPEKDFRCSVWRFILTQNECFSYFPWKTLIDWIVREYCIVRFLSRSMQQCFYLF